MKQINKELENKIAIYFNRLYLIVGGNRDWKSYMSICIREVREWRNSFPKTHDTRLVRAVEALAIAQVFKAVMNGVPDLSGYYTYVQSKFAAWPFVYGYENAIKKEFSVEEMEYFINHVYDKI